MGLPIGPFGAEEVNDEPAGAGLGFSGSSDPLLGGLAVEGFGDVVSGGATEGAPVGVGLFPIAVESVPTCGFGTDEGAVG